MLYIYVYIYIYDISRLRVNSHCPKVLSASEKNRRIASSMCLSTLLLSEVDNLGSILFKHLPSEMSEYYIVKQWKAYFEVWERLPATCE